MDWLNYHHLLYFWVVANEKTITKAAEKLHLSQPTLSNQLKTLEQSVGKPLFERTGRTMVLTETGQMVYRYADEIFTLGNELVDSINGMPTKDTLRLTVGVPDVLPKLIVYKLLEPAMQMAEKVQLVCYEGKFPSLLGDLAQHRLDVVLADSPVTPDVRIRAFNHRLGETSVSIFGVPELAKQYRDRFPESLHEAPMILQTQNTSIRRDLELWFDKQEIRPHVVHEFEDSAILKVFGQHGAGLFASPSAIEKDICTQYDVECLGRIESVKERFYAISVERRLKHPAVVAISEAARESLFES